MTSRTFTRQIGNSPAHVLYMFTHEHGWREWFCDSAWVQQREGGRLLLNWNAPDLADFYVVAHFTTIEADKKVELTWHPSTDPTPGKVIVEAAPTDGGTSLTLTHFFGAGATAASIERQAGLWETRFEVLQSLLERGLDPILERRPMLGIMLGALDEEVAKRLSLPAAEGVLLSNTIEGMGAHKAGLIGNDVIVRMGDTVVKGFNDIPNAMVGKQAGDIVEVEFYREGKTQITQMTLSARQMPEVPHDPAELAARLRDIHAELLKELDDLLSGVSDEAASARPAEGEWNVKEIIAHLVWGERDEHTVIGMHLSDDVSVFGINNVDARIKGLVAAHPTLADMRGLFARSLSETASIIERLPESFVSRKSSYVQFGQGILLGAFHPRNHFDQIRAALAVTAAKVPA